MTQSEDFLGPHRVWLMGIINVTPDSFSDGGHFLRKDAAIGHALALAAEGADIVDVGGESTRPGSRAVSEQEELDRVIPVIEGIRSRSPVAVSIDTQKSAVAKAAMGAGATLINDVSGFANDPAMPGVVAETGAWLCLMHMQGIPETMQRAPDYGDVVSEVTAFLGAAVQQAVELGVSRERILVDPGIGFGKRLEHNLALIRGCGGIGQALGCAVLMGVSRKSFLKAITGRAVEDRAFGTAAAVCACVSAGARVVRVHDVRAMRDVVLVAEKLV